MATQGPSHHGAANRPRLLLWIRVHSPFHSRDSRDIDESVVVELAFLSTASRRFLLLLLFNLWCLRLDLAGTRKRSVNFPHTVKVGMIVLWLRCCVVLRLFAGRESLVASRW